MTQQIGQPLPEGTQIFLFKLFLLRPPMKFQRLNRADNYSTRRRETGLPAFDIKKLLGPEIGSKPTFCDHIVRKCESRLGCHDGTASVGNVPERPAMDQSRIMFQRLHKVGIDGLFEQGGHGAFRLDVLRKDHISLGRPSHFDIA